jgi:anti-sigma factor RsiW
MPTCQQLTELVTDYLEGRMSDEERMQFEQHIALCRHCRGYFKQMRTIVDTLGRMPAEPVPDDVMDHLVEQFRERQK